MHSAARMTKAKPFDFTEAMTALCRDITQRLPAFEHVNMDYVLVGFTQCRNKAAHGTQARLTPMRFDGGADTGVLKGKWWHIQSLVHANRRILYLLEFFLPRFHRQSVRERFITVIHELYHISPDFDGSIRRFPGRCYVHGSSQRAYDQRMAELMGDYFDTKPDSATYSFLNSEFDELSARHGGIIGMTCPRPKLTRVQVRD